VKKIMRFKNSRDDLSFVSARVVARDTSPYFRVIRVVLDRGLEDGIKAGMPVVTNRGVVGRVEKVVGRYCDVMLLTDSRSRFSAAVRGKEVSGSVVGSGDGVSYAVSFQFPFQQAELNSGDVLVTTGHDQVFPRGVPVGKLVSGKIAPSGRHQEAAVAPSADISHLGEVLIIVNYQKQMVDPWSEEGNNGSQH